MTLSWLNDIMYNVIRLVDSLILFVVGRLQSKHGDAVHASC
jgi:hypothetical protein